MGLAWPAVGPSWSWLELSLSNTRSSFFCLLAEVTPAAPPLPKSCHANTIQQEKKMLGVSPVIGNRQYFRGRQNSHVVGSGIYRNNYILPLRKLAVFEQVKTRGGSFSYKMI